jgi:hypothetical protein
MPDPSMIGDVARVCPNEGSWGRRRCKCDARQIILSSATRHAKGKTLAENDDIDRASKNLNARILLTPEAGGVYSIVATSFQQAGRAAHANFLSCIVSVLNVQNKWSNTARQAAILQRITELVQATPLVHLIDYYLDKLTVLREDN